MVDVCHFTNKKNLKSVKQEMSKTLKKLIQQEMSKAGYKVVNIPVSIFH